MLTELELKQFALRIRAGILKQVGANGGGHIGGSLDLADLLAVLYGNYMRVKPENPDWEYRDYYISSKGHAGPALYAALALKGFMPYGRLSTLNQEGGSLPGHCDRMKVAGVDATTGSLGQGLSIACGLALGSKLKNSGQRVFCVTGDGESAEGQIWEAAQFAAHYKLQNLIVFLDWNKKQIDGTNDKVMGLGDMEMKYRSFGWNTYKTNGQDVAQINRTLQVCMEQAGSKPAMVLLDTVKGAGIRCIEEMEQNHCIGVPGQLFETCKKELEDQAEELGVALAW